MLIWLIVIKVCVLPMLFNSIPIESYMFSLLYAERDIGNKIFNSFYDWIKNMSNPY